jgi:hypothetical protein
MQRVEDGMEVTNPNLERVNARTGIGLNCLRKRSIGRIM